MRITQTPPALLSFILVVLSNTHSVSAGPYPKNELHDLGFGYLMDRGCDTFCGFDDMYCCSAGQTCFTNSLTIAECLTATTAAGWEYFTTLTTQTDLIVETITISSFTGAAATTTASNPETSVACQYALGETVCGAICCTSSQFCAQAGQCSPIGGTTTFSAPVLPTSGASTITQTATTTRPFETPVGTGSGSSIGITSNSTSSHSLSGGAIAGIVIGVIAAIILLILICFCCILRSGFDALLGIFGLGPNRNRRREEVITTEERYSRRNASAGGSRAQTHRGWFGGASRPARTTTVSEKRKSGGFGNMGYVGAGLLGLAAILGLKRRHDNSKVVKEERVTRVERSDISSDYYSDYYTGTTESKSSLM